jgi:thiol-disulfide isomerase/thioredoxin
MARPTKAQRRQQKRQDLEAQRRREAQQKSARTAAILGGIPALLIVTALVAWPRPSAEQVAADGASDTSATGWDLPRFDGEGRVALADFRGRPTVAAFFANWCTVCEWEVPELLAFSEEVGDRINFVGIDMMDNGGGLADARKWGIAGKWPLARDVGNGNGSGLSAETFDTRGSPLNVLYSPDGEVIHVQPGAISADQILALFQPSL